MLDCDEDEDLTLALLDAVKEDFSREVKFFFLISNVVYKKSAEGVQP